MKSKSFRTALGLAVGVAFSMIAGVAGAQESRVDAARDRTRSSPMSVDASLAFGQVLRRAGREVEALSELRRALAVSGGTSQFAARAHWELARTHLALRGFDGAMASCRAMSQLPPAEAASHVCAAEAHLLWSRGSEAEAEIAALATSKGASTEVRYFARLAKGRAHELASKDAEAEAAYREAIALFDARRDAYVLLGALLRRTGRDGVPQPAHLLVADAWAKKGDIDLAVEAYQAAFRFSRSDPTPLINGAKACLVAGRVSTAKAFAVVAARDFGSLPMAWTTLGDALAADHDVDGAREAYASAKKAQAKDAHAQDRTAESPRSSTGSVF